MGATDHADFSTRIARDGFAVVPPVVGPDRVESWAATLDAVFDAEADVATERGWLTGSYRASYALPAKDHVFVEACTDAAFVDLAASVLGADCRVAGCNGLDLVVGGAAQRLHADHPVPTPGVTLYLHLVCALDRFTLPNGATRVVPGSHRRDPTVAADPAARTADAVAVEVEPGGVVAFDGTLWHGAGANQSTGPRRALHLFYCRPWVQPHWDFPASMPVESATALSADQRRLLGFDGGPARWDAVDRVDVRPSTNAR